MAHVVDLRSETVGEENIPEGRNRPIRKVTLVAHMTDNDTEESMIVDPLRHI